MDTIGQIASTMHHNFINFDEWVYTPPYYSGEIREFCGALKMTSQTMPLGIVLEKCEIDNEWEPFVWQAVAVIPGAPEIDQWRVLDQGPGWTRYHAATMPLEIHRKETEGYKYNLGIDPPIIYLVLRYDDDAENGIAPFLATVCPFEAQAYLDGDEDLVEAVPMPDLVSSWLGEFVEQHHVDEVFYKRKRKPFDPRKGGGGESNGGLNSGSNGGAGGPGGPGGDAS